MMKQASDKRPYRLRPNDRFDCFGDYFSQDLFCRKYCALRLRCVVERDKDARYERYADLGFFDVELNVE